ncbi:MAG TPA: Asd/ArgC dimerization domain-containing protein [Bryobacteraceae bacterium]
MANKKLSVVKAVAAIAGGNTLIGREIQELVEDQKLPLRLELLDGEMTGGTLAVREDEALYLPPMTKQTLEGTRVVFLAGTPSSHQEAQRTAPKDAVLIDLTGALEADPEARLRAPGMEAAGAKTRLNVMAHPAAIALRQLLQLLSVSGNIERSVIVIYEPASELGHPGIGELDKQTRALLALQTVPQTVYDAQLAFNMLPAYGSEARAKLADIEARIARHLEKLLSGSSIAMPSLRLVQAPVFHGYSFSIWAEFAEDADPKKIETVLRAAKVDVRDGETAPASNVGTAQQSGLTVGSIVRDRNHPKAIWLWMVCDNLRVLGEGALKVAQEAL